MDRDGRLAAAVCDQAVAALFPLRVDLDTGLAKPADKLPAFHGAPIIGQKCPDVTGCWGFSPPRHLNTAMALFLAVSPRMVGKRIAQGAPKREW